MQKSVLVVGQVNAESITVVVDESWSGLQLELQFFNSTTHPEVPVVVILDSTMTCKVPPEVTKEVGIVHVALAGRDSGTIIKLSERLYYADAKIGADPQGGLTPEQQTPNYLAQMVEQATAAANAAKEAKKASEEAAKSAGAAGPYAEEAQKSAEAAKKAQDAAATSVQEAWNAKDQANIASNTAKGHADAAGTAKVAAERSAETAGNAQSRAAQSSQAAANSAQEAERAKQEAQKAAAALPAPSPEVAGMVPMVNQEGNGYIFGEAGGGGVGGELLQTISGENYGNVTYNFPEGKNTFFVVGTLNVNADNGTVVVYQNVKTYDKKFAYLPFWDFYGQEGKTLHVHLIFERVRIGKDGTSLLRLSGVVSSADTEGPGRRSTYLQSPWTDIDSNGLKLGLFTGFSISGTFDSVNLRVYGA